MPPPQNGLRVATESGTAAPTRDTAVSLDVRLNLSKGPVDAVVKECCKALHFTSWERRLRKAVDHLFPAFWPRRYQSNSLRRCDHAIACRVSGDR